MPLVLRLWNFCFQNYCFYIQFYLPIWLHCNTDTPQVMMYLTKVYTELWIAKLLSFQVLIATRYWNWNELIFDKVQYKQYISLMKVVFTYQFNIIKNNKKSNSNVVEPPPFSLKSVKIFLKYIEKKYLLFIKTSKVR